MEWKTSSSPVPYPEAVAFMEERVRGIRAGNEEECVWLLEHPPLYTAGTRAKPGDLLTKDRFPVYAAGRGGEYTYHGPGQRVAYAMLDLKRLFAPAAPDLRAYVRLLEAWLINTLKEFGVEGFTREERVGVWVRQVPDAGCQMQSLSPTPDTRHPAPDFCEAKIAALGVRVRQWVSYHGIALNVRPDLSHYAGIVPCGIREYGVTSLADIGVRATMAEADAALKRQFGGIFNPP